MRENGNDFQEDLFGASKPKTLRFKVKELDHLIAHAIKKKDYQKAKELTDLQSKIIQELVTLGEEEV